jgi:hypothetical protein
MILMVHKTKLSLQQTDWYTGSILEAEEVISL